jgi:hypothetical protein
MFRSTEAEVPGNGFSVSATCGHTSSTLPSTGLLYLREHNHSAQAWWASCLTVSTGNETPAGRCECARGPAQGYPH